MNKHMNTHWIVFHLGEARRVLADLEHRIESGSLDSMEEVDLAASIAEAWGHLNAAWNGRRDASLTVEGLARMSDQEFRRLRSAIEDLEPV